MTMKKGKVSKWLKKEGDTVKKGEGLFEVETEKITNTAEATMDGWLFQIIADVGSVVNVGETVGILAEEGEMPEKVQGGSAGASSGKKADAEQKYVPASPSAKRLAKELGIALADVTGTGKDGRITETDVREFHEKGSGQPGITPVARNMIEAEGLNPADIQGTGEGGKITKSDVIAALNQTQAHQVEAEPSTAAAEASHTVIPYEGMRRAIGVNMCSSLQNAAQLTTFTEVDVTNLVAWHTLLKQEYNKDESIRISLNDILIYSTARVLKQHPIMNSTLVDEEILLHNQVNMGIAVAIPDGLIVPKLRYADRKSLVEISKESRELITKARNRSLSADEVIDGTFTITNVSALGMDGFTPVLNPPETGILGVGRVIEKPAVWQGEIAIRSMMTLSLTFDHRVVDGSPAMSFLQSLAGCLKNPVLLLR